VYRSEPFPLQNSNREFLALWQKYVNYIEPSTHIGVSNEMTLSELKRLTSLSTAMTDKEFELIALSTKEEYLDNHHFYGIDIVGVGGYSLLGDGCWLESRNEADSHMKEKAYFKDKLNRNLLFSSARDAEELLTLLKASASCDLQIENEKWQMVYVYKIEV
jgi:hypothetical protein